MVEGTRLESVHTPKEYRGFESLSLRQSSPGAQRRAKTAAPECGARRRAGSVVKSSAPSYDPASQSKTITPTASFPPMPLIRFGENLPLDLIDSRCGASWQQPAAGRSHFRVAVFQSWICGLTTPALRAKIIWPQSLTSTTVNRSRSTVTCKAGIKNARLKFMPEPAPRKT